METNGILFYQTQVYYTFLSLFFFYCFVLVFKKSQTISQIPPEIKVSILLGLKIVFAFLIANLASSVFLLGSWCFFLEHFKLFIEKPSANCRFIIDFITFGIRSLFFTSIAGFLFKTRALDDILKF